MSANREIVKTVLRGELGGRGLQASTVAARSGLSERSVAALLGAMKRDGLVEHVDVSGPFTYADEPPNWRLVGQLQHHEQPFRKVRRASVQ